jgi:hypothetical protein
MIHSAPYSTTPRIATITTLKIALVVEPLHQRRPLSLVGAALFSVCSVRR